MDQATAARIISLRKTRGFTQTTVAKALGVTFQQIQKYERGINRIGPGALTKLASLFEVPISELFDQETCVKFAGNRFSALFEPEGANELMRAYVNIQDLEVRREVLAIVRGFARINTHLVELEASDVAT